MNDIRIMISSALNQGKAIKDLNESIRAIEKHPSLQKIKLKIDIDQKFTQSINQFISAVSKMKKISDEQSKTVSQTQEVYKNLDGTVKTITTTMQKNGEVLTKTKITHDANKKAMQDESLAVAKLTQDVNKLNTADLDSIKILRNKVGAISKLNVKSSQGYSVTSKNVGADGQTMINSTTTTNYKKEREEEQKLIKSKEELRKKILELAQAGQLSTVKLQELARGTNQSKNAADIQKVIDKYNELKKVSADLSANQTRQYQNNKRQTEQQIKDAESLLRAQRAAEVQVTNLNRRFGSNIDSTGLNNLLSQLKSLDTTSANYRSEATRLQHEINKIGANARTAAGHTLSFGDAMKTAFQKFPIWMIATTAFYAPIRAMQSGIKSIYELDTALTNLQKVTDATGEEYKQFLADANSTAGSLGSLTLDVVKASTEWARLGYNMKQVQALAAETTIYSNVGDMGAEDASKALISAIKGFGIEIDEEGKNIRNIVDIYNEVGNKYAISSAGIGEALRRSASSLSAAGNTIEESVALITAANSTLQDPVSVGTALKTVSMRIRGISEDGEDLGDLIPTLEKKFNSLGLSLKKDENTFKSTYEIMKDLAQLKSEGMTDFQLADITELVAGKRQGNIITSLLDNWADAENSLKTALDSAGSAARENSKYLESMKARVAIFKNEVVGFWNEAMSSDFLKMVINMGTTLVKVFGSMSNAIGLLPSALTFVATAMLLLGTSTRATVMSISSSLLPVLGISQLSLTKFSLSVNRAAYAMGLGATSARVFTASLIGLTRIALPLAAIAALTYGISKLFEAYQKNKQLQKDIDQQNKTIAESWLTQKQSISELIVEYQKLNEVTNNGKLFSGIEEENRYKEVIEKLSSLMPNLVSQIDEKGNKHLKTADAIKQELIYAEKLAGIEQNQSILDAETNFGKQIKDIDKLQNKIKDFQAQVVLGGSFAGSTFIPYSESDLNKMEYQMLSLQQQVSTSSNIIRDNVKSLISSILSVNDIKVNETMSGEIDKIVASLNVEGLDKEALVDKSNAVASFVSSINSLSDVSSFSEGEKLSKAIYTSGEAIGYTNVQIQEFINKQLELAEAQKDTTDEIKSFDQVLSEVNAQYETSSKSLSNLNSLLEAHAEGKSISAEEAKKMVDADASMIEMFRIENGQIYLNIDAINNKRDAELATFNDIAKSREADLISSNAAIFQKITNMGFEMDALTDLATAYSKVNALYNEQFQGVSSFGEGIALSEEKAKVDGVLDSLALLRQQTELSKSSLKTIGTNPAPKDKKDKSSTSSASKDEAKLISLTQSRINAINLLSSAQSELNKTLSSSIDTDTSFATQITATNDLIASQTTETNLLQDANKKLRIERDKVQATNSKYDMSTWIDANGEATTSFNTLYNSMSSGSAQESLQSLFDQYSQYDQAITANRSSIAALNGENQKLIKTLDETKLAFTQNYLSKREASTSSKDKVLEDLKLESQLLDDQTMDYKENIEIQVKALTDKGNAIQSDIEWARERLLANQSASKAEKLTSDQLKEVNNFLETNTKKLKENQVELKNVTGNLVTWIDTMKSSAFSTANDIIEAEKKIAQTVLDQQESELNAYKKTQQFRLDSIQATIDSLQEQWRLEAENAERSEQVAEISRLNQIANILQTNTLSSISDELAKQLKIEDLKKKEIEHQNSLLKKQQELQTVQQEKNVKMLIEGSFQYIADPRKVRELQEQIADMEEDYSEQRKDDLEGVLDDLKSKEESFLDWQKKINREATITALERQKKAIEDETKLRDDKFTEDQDAFTLHYANMDILAANYLDTLKATYGDKWDEILGVLQGKLLTAETMYNKLRGYDGVSIPSSNGSSSSANSTTSQIDQMQKNSNDWHYASAEDKKKLSQDNKDIAKQLEASGVKTEYNSKTGKWDILKYHDGLDAGIVGQKKQSFASVLSSKLGIGRNEQFAKLLNGEGINLDPINMAANVLKTVQGAMQLGQASIGNVATAGGSTVDKSETYHINIDKVVSNDATQWLKQLRQQVKNKY